MINKTFKWLCFDVWNFINNYHWQFISISKENYTRIFLFPTAWLDSLAFFVTFLNRKYQNSNIWHASSNPNDQIKYGTFFHVKGNKCEILSLFALGVEGLTLFSKCLTYLLMNKPVIHGEGGCGRNCPYYLFCMFDPLEVQI